MTTPVEKSERERLEGLIEIACAYHHFDYAGTLHLAYKNADIGSLRWLANAAFEAGRSAGEAGWISVEERLPEDGLRVWVYAVRADGSELSGESHYYAVSGWYPLEDQGMRNKPRITHWQPLPAGPIADKGDAK